MEGYSLTLWESGVRRTDYEWGESVIDFNNGTMAQIFPNQTVVFETNGTFIAVKQLVQEGKNQILQEVQPQPKVNYHHVTYFKKVTF